MYIPVLDAQGRVVGWTTTPPTMQNGKLVHDGASRLLKSELATGEVVLTEAEDIRRAGAPAGWDRPWRCLAICPAASAGQFGASRVSELLSRVPGANPALRSG
jgi:hypothetical protein